jgi:hypothetical protein
MATGDLKSFFEDRSSFFEQKNTELLAMIRRGDQIDTGFSRKIGYKYINIVSKDPFRIHYVTDQRGIGVGSYGTGVAYLEREPDIVYESLESMYDKGQGIEGFVGYGHLKGKWYYFYWKAD